jgi:putative ABC transport system permease protein
VTATPASGTLGSHSHRVFWALLRSLFPKTFRSEFGTQMLQVFADRLRDARSERRTTALIAFWSRTLTDLLVSGVRLRIGAFGDAFGRWRRNRKNKKGMGDWMFSLLSDLRYALRTLWKDRGFTVVAVLTLAIGIGANTAIFSVLNGVVLKPLPYPEPDRIVSVWPGRTLTKGSLVQFEQQMLSYSGLSGISHQTLTLTGNGEPEEFWGASVSVNHFAVIGIAPMLGRAFLLEEREPGRSNVVILSHGLWQRRFGADPGIIGQTIPLGGAGGELRTVVGVMAPDYRAISASLQAWLPLTIDPTNSSDYSGTASLTVIGRLSPGVTMEQASLELQAIVARWQEEGLRWLSDDVARTATVVSVLETLVGDVRSRLVVLLAAVGLVLLIACTNVANLLLARGAARQREIGIRMAIGAGRSRILRQLLTETAVLGLVGGFVGLAFAVWTLSALKGSLPSSVPRADLISIDVSVLGFTVAVSLVASLVFGFLPALRSTGCDLQATLHEGGKVLSGGRRRHRLHQSLVIVETALAVMLVAGAGLMLKSFWLINRVDPGFTPEGLVTMRLSPPEIRYGDSESLCDYYSRVTEQVEAVPGVVSVGTNIMLPLAAGNIAVLYDVEDDVLPEGEHRPRANVRSVSPSYFRTMGIPVVEGRGFDAADGTPESLSMVLNETMARDLAPDGTAIGKRIGGFFGETFTVVGVVRDVRQQSLQSSARQEMYLPYQWWSSSNMYLFVRTQGDAARQIPALQQAVWSVDEDVPISRTNSMEEVIARSLGDFRFLTQLLTAFAGLALVLGAIGVYGVLSYAVSQRTSEIGIRMALGAPHGAVLRSALGQGVALVAGGVVVGILGAAAASRVLSGFLYGVSATDPMTFAAVGLFLMVVAVVASFIPARRASRIDPIEALRLE